VIVIKFSCINQRLRRITSGIIPSNAYGKLKFEFDFRTDDWNAETTKTANFSYRGDNYPIELDEHNQCFVPKEVICSPSFSVAVHGGDIVTNYVRNPVEEVKSSTGTIPPTDSETTTGVVFVPHIDEDKILSWTVKEGIDGTEEIPSVDLNPFDEWTEDGDVISEYEWEEDV
jgi:hypothetical protein